MNKQILFEAGKGSYSSYRIPTVIALPGGRVIAFCEGRLHGAGDSGTIEILARISEDGGASFAPPFRVAGDGENTVGNPSPVYDRVTGKLHLLFNGNDKSGAEAQILKGHGRRGVYTCESSDGGKTWSAPRNLTAMVKLPAWTWYATGPCHAQQLLSGRLLVACNHAVLDGPEGGYLSHAIYSDDHGVTWKVGGDVGLYTNECSLAQLKDGRIYINMRSYRGKGCRAVAYSEDGGQSWQGLRDEPALPDPVCQGSVLGLGDEKGRPTDTLLFSNAASASRRNLTVRRSSDGGQSWSQGTVLYAGDAAYSDLCQLPGGNIGCLYECGENGDPYARIEWAVMEENEIQ